MAEKPRDNREGVASAARFDARLWLGSGYTYIFLGFILIVSGVNSAAQITTSLLLVASVFCLTFGVWLIKNPLSQR